MTEPKVNKYISQCASNFWKEKTNKLSNKKLNKSNESLMDITDEKISMVFSLLSRQIDMSFVAVALNPQSVRIPKQAMTAVVKAKRPKYSMPRVLTKQGKVRSGKI